MTDLIKTVEENEAALKVVELLMRDDVDYSTLEGAAKAVTMQYLATEIQKFETKEYPNT